MFVLSCTYNTLSTYASYRITRNIRQQHLKAALSQDIAFFDMGSSGSIATHAISNSRLIQGGISEKFGLTFQGISCFIIALIIAFVTQWKLTLIGLQGRQCGELHIFGLRSFSRLFERPREIGTTVLSQEMP
ncbi:hypothetical protein BKA66DRAFT_471082 [Pyrenochaeta sp. MPI-SDFR-AT-0127]|nr:hypothetical protein BKA66DRAFT_471082 [Pyrenochaeta sp. MPI-SDFR-AT-0127]